MHGLLTRLGRFASALLAGKAAARRGTEADVGDDEHQALRRPVDGDTRGAGHASTTGTGHSGTFVGRIAGEDPAEDDTAVRRRGGTPRHQEDPSWR